MRTTFYNGVAIGILSIAALYGVAWVILFVVLPVLAFIVPAVGYIYAGAADLSRCIIPSSVVVGVTIGYLDCHRRRSSRYGSSRDGSLAMLGSSVGLAVAFVAIAATAGRLFTPTVRYIEVGHLNWPAIVGAGLVYGIILLPVSLPVIFLMRSLVSHIVERIGTSA